MIHQRNCPGSLLGSTAPNHTAQGGGIQAEHSSFAEMRDLILEFKAAEAVEIAGLGIRQEGLVQGKSYDICIMVP